MMEQSLYYCWFCDAHRLPASCPDHAACCPRCGQELPPDAKLDRPALKLYSPQSDVIPLALFVEENRRAA